MKFIPILFSTPMIQAILDDSKTQTRRSIKGLEKLNDPYFQTLVQHATGKITFASLTSDQIVEPKCPYGQVGDILWVREKFSPTIKADKDTSKPFFYYTDFKDLEYSKKTMKEIGWKMKPSIHMPKAACRLFLKVKSVHPERLHQISDDDCLKEGIIDYNDGTYKNYFTKKGFREQDGVECLLPRASFQSLWCSINGLKSWENNPWVWVVEFERITLNLSEMNLFLNNTINQK